MLHTGQYVSLSLLLLLHARRLHTGQYYIIIVVVVANMPAYHAAHSQYYIIIVVVVANMPVYHAAHMSISYHYLVVVAHDNRMTASLRLHTAILYLHHQVAVALQQPVSQAALDSNIISSSKLLLLLLTCPTLHLNPKPISQAAHISILYQYQCCCCCCYCC